MKIIILAAGIGSRLGNPFPKCLTMLKNGCSILQNQVKGLARYVDIFDVLVVVGFKKELMKKKARRPSTSHGTVCLPLPRTAGSR